VDQLELFEAPVGDPIAGKPDWIGVNEFSFAGAKDGCGGRGEPYILRKTVPKVYWIE
jgi:hypothetical protein